MAEITLESVRSKQYDLNLDNAGGEDHNTCFICGKRLPVGIKSASYVHYTTHGNLTDEQTHPNSQGFFPVGPECKKKLRKNFLHKF